MTSHIAPTDELMDLMCGLAEDRLSREGVERLDALLCADPMNCQHYIDFMATITRLSWIGDDCNDDAKPMDQRQPRGSLTQQAIDRECETSISHSSAVGSVVDSSSGRSEVSPFLLTDTIQGRVTYFSSGMPLAYLVATIILSIALWAGSLIPVFHGVQLADKSSPQLPFQSERQPVFVGQITGMVDCQWADDGTATIDRAHVPIGRKYALASGLMEITYDTGAKVILQGPCTYEVESSVGGFLSVGKLTAKLEAKEERRTKNEELSGSRSSFLIPHSYFAVRTPTATVTDLGTEFGVEVQESGATATHVFAGTVEVQTAAHNNAQGKMIRLSENESALVEKQEGSKDVTVRRVATDSASYVRAGQLPKLAEERRLKELRRWQAYSQELRRDPSLVAYYDFQQKPGSPAVLPNVAANGDKSLDGVAENATWTNGRMPGKHALRFVMPGSGVRVAIPGEFKSLTLAAWVNFETIPTGHKAILMTDDWGRPGQIHWQFGGGTFSLGIYQPQSDPDGEYSQQISITLGAADLGKWRHLAFVYDSQTRQATSFIDGREIAMHAMQKITPLVIGNAQIGEWNGLPDHEFPGRIDELLISDRPWTSAEVERCYREGLGRPVANANP